MSLYEIFMNRALHEHQNELNADNAYQVLPALAQGVAQGVQAEQQFQMEERARENNFQRKLKLATAKGDDISKIQEMVVKAGRKVPLTREEGLESLREEAVEQEQIEQDKLSLQKSRLEFQKEQDMRRLANQKLAQNIGIKVDPKSEVDKFIMQEFGFDAESTVQLGLGTMNPDGTITLKPSKERQRLIDERTVPRKVQEYIAELKDSKDILQDAVAEFNNQDLNEVKVNWNIFQQLLNPAGPLSVQARSSLIRNLSNPKLEALANKLDRAFQKYRKQITGAQASDKELRTLRPLIANLSQNPEAFLLNAQDMLRETDQILTNRIGVLRDAGRDENVISKLENRVFGNNTTPITTNTTQQNSSGSRFSGMFY